MVKPTKKLFTLKNPLLDTVVKEKKTEESTKLVIFSIDKELYALSIFQVVEIDRLMEITPVPNVGEYIVGLIDLRGEILPVVDPEKKFGLKRENVTLNRCIIICKTTTGSYGMIVDEVFKIINFPVSQINEPPNLIKNKIKNDYLKGVGILDGRVFVILDTEKILLPEEIKVTKSQ